MFKWKLETASARYWTQALMVNGKMQMESENASARIRTHAKQVQGALNIKTNWKIKNIIRRESNRGKAGQRRLEWKSIGFRNMHTGRIELACQGSKSVIKTPRFNKRRKQVEIHKTEYAKYRTCAKEVQGAQNAAFHTQSPSLNQTAGIVFPVVFSGHTPVEASKFFPELNMLYTVGKVLLRRTRIYDHLSLELHGLSRSNRNILSIKISFPHISLDS